jgi:hypothetical protein
MMSFGTGAAEEFETGTRKLPEGFWCQFHAICEPPGGANQAKAVERGIETGMQS